MNSKAKYRPCVIYLNSKNIIDLLNIIEEYLKTKLISDNLAIISFMNEACP